MNLSEIIGQNIIDLRKSNNMTQFELAEKLSYSDKAVSKWENGNATPDVAVLMQIATIFNVSLNYLVTEPGTQTKEDCYISRKKKMTKNERTLTILCSISVFAIAVILYIVMFFATREHVWQLFVWSAPMSLTVATVFCSIWSGKRNTLIVSSLLLWSFLLAFFFQFLPFALWQIFLLGFPIQLVLLLSFNFKFEK